MSGIKHIFFVLFVFSVFACNTSVNEGKKTESENDKNYVSDSVFIFKNKPDTSEILYVKDSGLVFFSLSDKEFKQFLHFTGKESEWDFKIIYKRFKKLALNTKKAVGDKINVIYSVSPEIAFIDKRGDTLFFKRKENDLFIGQIFFSGKGKLKITEGLMKKDSLEFYIKNFFNLKEDINIKRVVIQIDNQPLRKKDTLQKTEIDTVVAP